MRRSLLPLALLALSLPAPALAHPLKVYAPLPVHPYGYGISPGYRYRYPVAVIPGYALAYPAVAYPGPAPLRRCGPGPALVGVAVGTGLGALLADGPRERRWALPMGAAVGGILGGVASGC